MPAKRLSRIPVEVSSTDAATLPIAGNTAITILDRCRVGAESRVLVIGAGGGVGTLTVQLAAERGAEVWATCGARAEQTLQRLGATRTFDYRTTDLAALPAGTFDAVVDIAGEPPLTLLRGLLRNGGSVALVGGEGGGVLGPIPRMVRAMLATRRGRSFRSIAAVTRTAVTEQLLELAAAGRLTPVIERTFALADAQAALAHVDAGHTLGKVVVQSAPGRSGLHRSRDVREWMPACPSRTLLDRCASCFDVPESRIRRPAGPLGQRPPPLSEEHTMHAEHRAGRRRSRTQPRAPDTHTTAAT